MPVSNPKETIDPRILRLIGLDDVFDLDYDTYLTLLKEAMVKGRMTNTTIPTEEVELLTNEYKRVKSKKDQGRFKVEKKKISTGSFGVGKVKGLIAPAGPKGMLPAGAISKSPAINKVEEDISAIAKSMNSIVEILSGQKKLSEDAAAYEKRKAEQDKRALAESKLEKRFEGLKKAAEKVLAPVKSILSKIIDFLTTVFLGRVVYKLIEWFGDPQNASKVQSIIRFFGDHWPKLLSLYILFGTSLGKFARGLIRVAVKGTIKLGLAIAKLLAAKKVKGAMGAARFLGGGKGRLLGAGITALGTAGLAYAGTKALEGGEDKAQGFRGGGFVIPRFYGGGFNNFFSGLVNGQKGVDKVPAMLTDGEFVMSRGAVQKYGVDTLEAMNAAGGGTNKPKMMGGTVYAAGGGPIGDKNYNYRSSNTPFTKDPIDAINRFIKFKFGVDISNQNTWGTRSSAPSRLGLGTTSTSTGSLLTDPVGALSRISGNIGMKQQLPGQRSTSPNIFSRVLDAAKQKLGGGKTPAAPSKPGEKGFFQELQEKLTGSGAATYRDAGSIYAKQMLGGMGGPVSERDLSKESQQELQKAIQRAKKRTGSEISKAEAKIKELRAQGAKDGNPALETQKSFLKKLKSGGIRVQYADYAEKGKMSESAKNAKNILGQFWATQRSEKEGGGYRIEDKYDFDKMKKKDEKTGKMRDMNFGELLTEGVFGKGKSTQQRLQAAHQMNIFRGKGDVDMVLGGKRTISENLGLSASKTFLGGLLGISGKPKQQNQITKSKPNAQIARSKPIGKSVKPPVRVTRSKADTIGAGGYGGGKGSAPRSGTKTPQFSARNPGASNAKQKVLGMTS